MTPLETEMLSFLSAGGQSLLTRHTYRAGLAHFRRYFFATQGWQDDTPIADLGPENIWEFPAYLLRQTYRPSRSAAPLHLADTTRKLHLLAASRFIRFLVLRRRLPLFDFAEYELIKDELKRAVRVRDKPIARKIPPEATILAVVEVARIPRTFDRKTLPSGRYRLTLIWYRDLAIILALKSSGMRVGELVSLKRGELDYDRQGAWVTGKGGKTRFVAFDDEAWAAIQSYLGQRNDEATGGAIGKHPLFCRHDRHIKSAARWPMTVRAVNYVVKELAGQAAVSFNLHPHSFRHYFANKLLAFTGNLALVQDALGHSDPKTTRIYCAIKPEDIAWAIQALSAFTEVEGARVFEDVSLEHRFLTETYIPMLEKKLSDAQSRLLSLSKPRPELVEGGRLNALPGGEL
jgi:site-specific recombinase XerD